MFKIGRKKKLIGIDIGTTSIKLVEISKVGTALRLERYAYQPIAHGLVVERQVQKTGDIANLLTAALKQLNTKTTRAAICVPSSAIMTKVIAVQEGLGGALETVIELEADRVIPYPLDEVNIDFQVLGPSVYNPGEKDVQIVACRKNVVDGLISVMQDVGLTPEYVDVDTFSLARLHRMLKLGHAGGDRKTTTVLVDFGLNTTRLIVFHGSDIVYSRESPFGGRQLVDGIHQKFKIKHEDAITQLRSRQLPQDYKLVVLRPFIKTLLHELVRAFQFFYSSSTYNKIDRIVLCGGCAQIGNIEKIIAQRLEIPTLVCNPFAAMKIDPKIDQQKLKRNLPCYAVACGLSMRGFE